MLVKFNPSKEEKGSGVTAFASWDNYDLQRVLKTIVFNVKHNAVIETLEITPEGITARLTTSPELVSVCGTCGIGHRLPSGRCDHCNSLF